MNSFDATTTVQPDESSPGLFHGRFDAGWQVGNGINGGVVLSLAGRALAAALPDDRHPDPIAVTATYLSASVPGPVTVRTDIVRRGGSLSTGTATVSQAGPDGTEQPRAIVQGMFGALDALPDDAGVQREPPAEMPPPSECLPSSMAPPEFTEVAPIMGQLDLRFDPETIGWAVGEPANRGVIQAWLKFADGREPDPWALLYAIDALPPALADFGRFGWCPTLQLSGYVRAGPAPGWLLVRHETEHVSGGQFEEDVRIWDSTGLLVAQGRQLARTPRS